MRPSRSDSSSAQPQATGLWGRAIGAGADKVYFPPAGAMERLGQLARGAVVGTPSALSIEGPAGSGKSELLVRWAQAATAADEYQPIVIHMEEKGAYRGGPIDQVIRQLLTHSGKVDGLRPAVGHEDSIRLAGICLGAGLGELTPWIGKDEEALGNGRLWHGLLTTLRELKLPAPVFLLIGASGGDAKVRETLAGLLCGIVGGGGCVAFEAPAIGPDLEGTIAESLQRFALQPLAPAQACQLAQSIGEPKGCKLPEACLLPVVERMGPWPGWVRGYAMHLEPHPRKQPRRIAEEAYLNWLTTGGWAQTLSRQFEATVEISLHESALQMLRILPGQAAGLDLVTAATTMGAPVAAAGRLLENLTRLGLVIRSGSRWLAPRWPALMDWVELKLAETTNLAGADAARMNMLARLLAQPADEAALAASGLSVERTLPEVLKLFAGQVLPEVLFNFNDYWEAVGRLRPAQRREVIEHATASLRLPEVLGVARWEPPRGARPPMPVYFSRAFRDGKYQRSHEEIWMVADLSETRSLTSPEVTRTLEAFERLERQLGPSTYRRWLIIGASTSAEAADMIRRHHLFSSNREQLGIVLDILGGRPAPPDGRQIQEEEPEPAPSVSTAPAAAAAAVPVSQPEPQPIGHLRSVIELHPGPAGPLARPEIIELNIPARQGCEVRAAVMAGGIAQEAGFDTTAAGQIKTAVLEGVLNAIEHSPNPEKQIFLQFILREATFEITIENEGETFDPLRVPVPDPQAKLKAVNKRGWGISLMKRFMDEVAYEPCSRGTRLRLTKYRSSDHQMRSGRASQSLSTSS